MNIDWEWKDFDSLTTRELYRILQLRELVFQLEQESLYQDIDNLDFDAEHLLGYHASDLIAYLRIHVKEDNLWMGRVVVDKMARKKGIGNQLVEMSIQHLRDKDPTAAIYTSAQAHQQDFYRRFGFETISEPYDDGGILHVRMELQNSP